MYPNPSPSPSISPSVPVPSTIILGTNHQTSPLLCPSINRLNNINKLLFVFQHPIQLIIVSRSKITHHVLIAEEEHDGAGIVELVHGLKIGHLVEVAKVDGAEVLHTVGDLVEHFVLRHAVRVGVAAEADQD